jgi:hypothetical protein
MQGSNLLERGEGARQCLLNLLMVVAMSFVFRKAQFPAGKRGKEGHFNEYQEKLGESCRETEGASEQATERERGMGGLL